jgi:hypothetical protein
MSLCRALLVTSLLDSSFRKMRSSLSRRRHLSASAQQAVRGDGVGWCVYTWWPGPRAAAAEPSLSDWRGRQSPPAAPSSPETSNRKQKQRERDRDRERDCELSGGQRAIRLHTCSNLSTRCSNASRSTRNTESISRTRPSISTARACDSDSCRKKE